MNSAHGTHLRPHVVPRERHLTLVQAAAEPVRPPRSAAMGALLAGLASGFVMAALAATLGGGNPTLALAMAAVCASGMALALVAARRATVRRRAIRGRHTHQRRPTMDVPTRGAAVQPRRRAA